MSLVVHDPDQGLKLTYRADGRLVQAEVLERPGTGESGVRLPLLKPGHTLPVFAATVAMTFESPGCCWSGVAAFSSCHTLGQARLLCQQAWSGEGGVALHPEVGFGPCPLHGERLLPYLLLQQRPAGEWIFTHS